ncbi:DNRLRE domain-containing protein [Clostridium botulinum]|uniref:DNRLRE domain-containing protein n=1 Tax=Clostridium botulinum TaxID=1491 RepID=UPI00005DB53A|nr:DNRLRE domain-containing protein [Clostridium botulinum]YP_398544.1 hypothetical protein CST114 [Clostridium phage c-st]BAE47812.1 hypothetical protein CST114 [Clostridium phage c-st]
MNKIFKNKMEAIFNVTWHKHNDALQGNVNVSDKNDILQGCVNVNRTPKNKMEAMFQVNIPKREYIELDSIKDTYVTTENKALNYGDRSSFKIGLDNNNNIFRSLIQFDLSKVPKTYHICSIKLRLYSYDMKSFNNLEVSLPTNEWGEYNVVWGGQPSRLQLVSIVNLEKDKTTYDIDITDIAIQWLYKDINNNGLILKSYDENDRQLKQFSSRESENKPQLIVEYIDTDLFNGTNSVMKGHIRVRRNEISDLQSQISVFRHSDDNSLDGIIHTHNMNELEGNISVSYHNGINGHVKVYHPTYESDLQCYMFIRNELLSGSVKIAKQDSMMGIVTVKPLEKSDLNGIGKISDRKELDGKVLIYKYKDDSLNGEVDIYYKNELYGYVKPTYCTYNNMKGQITTILKSELTGTVKVNPVAFRGN